MRFAPSPTGFLHVGGLRTALFNYLFAAKSNGKAILRVEDTDQNRKVEGAVENLVESLKWSGVQFDEGAEIGGDYGPYIQSQRLAIYQKHANQLVREGKAYFCFCSADELSKIREDQLEKKLARPYDGRCQFLPEAEIQKRMDQNLPFVIRMKIPQDFEAFHVSDLIRGDVKFKTSQIDDQILIKSDGFPTYHLANVVDDFYMKITHVIRGEEWLPSTPKHIQLYEYFGWPIPQFAHLPLLLNPDKSKLSKRQGDVATEDYREKGYLPEALINFVALLGWNTQDDQEIFSMSELKEKFSLDRVGKAGAVFDVNKLKWMNQQYIKEKTPEELYELVQPFLPDIAKTLNQPTLTRILNIVKDSMVLLTDIEQKLDLFCNENPTLTDTALIEISKTEDAQKVYKALLNQLERTDELSSENFGSLMKAVQKETGIKGKGLWGSVRVAITLVEHGPDLGAVVDIFGKAKCLKMIQNVIQ
jgi:nondiscriminating glutamyl-tRNA synthetase